jgi:FlaA1/EpsC-like NDP-sugar epimerase
MSATKLSARTIGILLADATIIYGGIALALYLRLGVSGSEYQLNENNGWYKIALATAVCTLVLYFYDLYDFTVMGNRRELMLRLVQALGIAWALLALLFYFAPPLLIGRGVSVISVPLVLGLLLGWRIVIHYLTGHPEIGEKILVVGTGKTARDTADAVLERRDAGYRIVGFVTENGIPPHSKISDVSVLGTTDNLEEIIKKEKVDRIVIAVRERRGNFPTEALLKMSLAGDVSIEECTSFFERVTGQVHIDIGRSRAGSPWHGAGRIDLVIADRDHYRDFDQARIERSDLLQAGTRRRAWPDLQSDQVPFDAHRCRKRRRAHLGDGRR